MLPIPTHPINIPAPKTTPTTAHTKVQTAWPFDLVTGLAAPEEEAEDDADAGDDEDAEPEGEEALDAEDEPEAEVSGREVDDDPETELKAVEFSKEIAIACGERHLQLLDPLPEVLRDETLDVELDGMANGVTVPVRFRPTVTYDGTVKPSVTKSDTEMDVEGADCPESDPDEVTDVSPEVVGDEVPDEAERVAAFELERATA